MKSKQYKCLYCGKDKGTHQAKTYSKRRLEGEWIKREGISYEDIESNIYCPYERLYLNDQIEIDIAFGRYLHHTPFVGIAI